MAEQGGLYDPYVKRGEQSQQAGGDSRIKNLQKVR